jgi:hypothetical protein
MHNYADKTIMGHMDRENDEEAYDDDVYATSVFDNISGSGTVTPTVTP